MKRVLCSLALLAVAVSAPPAMAQKVGSVPPELKAVKWYNSPALSLEDLRERAVLIEVFRTW
jgi:hypothetical protein